MRFPLLMYDDYCTSCTKYALLVDRLTHGQITIFGLYSKEGREFRKSNFPEGYEGTEMSWFCTKDKCYGGRSGLANLIKYILFGKKEIDYPSNTFNLHQCNTDCGTVKGVMFRSMSILTMSKEISTKC